MPNPTLQTMIDELMKLEGDFIFPEMSLTHEYKEVNGDKMLIFTFDAPKEYNAAYVLSLNVSDNSKEEQEAWKAQIAYATASFYTRELARKWEGHPEYERVVEEEKLKF